MKKKISGEFKFKEKDKSNLNIDSPCVSRKLISYRHFLIKKMKIKTKIKIRKRNKN